MVIIIRVVGLKDSFPEFGLLALAKSMIAVFGTVGKREMSSCHLVVVFASHDCVSCVCVRSLDGQTPEMTPSVWFGGTSAT